MIECRNLELHVAHGCNLSCESCAHYSNHHHTEMLSLATAREWLSAWSKCLRPRQFSLLGGEPEASWRNCPAKWCLQLHEGKLWKCPAIAYLGMQDRRYGLGKEWRPHLEYQPLLPDCDDEVLRQFVDQKTERICAMCPARPQRIGASITR